MMEFAVALNALKTTPLVVSISWGWAESDQCNIMETGYVARPTITMRNS